MASTIVGLPVASGPQQLVSGNPWSGSFHPIGGLHVVLDVAASGSVYINFSGNATMNSGSFYTSGNTGINDGYQLKPGGTTFIPKTALISGTYNIFLWWDAACSGQARLYYTPAF